MDNKLNICDGCNKNFKPKYALYIAYIFRTFSKTLPFVTKIECK